MKRPDPNKNRLGGLHTLEVTPRDGNVWLEIHHGITVSVTALFPAEARAIAKSLVAAADKAGGKPRKCRHRLLHGIDGRLKCAYCAMPAAMMNALAETRPPESYPGGRAFGLTIRGRRQQAGLTLRRCAEAMGISMYDLSRIERGERLMTPTEFEAFGRASQARPEPAPGVDARTDDGRFIGGTGYGGERR